MRCPASELFMYCPARLSEEAPWLEGALGPAPRQPTTQLSPARLNTNSHSPAFSQTAQLPCMLPAAAQPWFDEGRSGGRGEGSRGWRQLWTAKADPLGRSGGVVLFVWFG
ncbi:hypothetical protein Droror1_Dr00014739 [Drosera rotundifolia]